MIGDLCLGWCAFWYGWLAHIAWQRVLLARMRARSNYVINIANKQNEIAQEWLNVHAPYMDGRAYIEHPECLECGEKCTTIEAIRSHVCRPRP